MSYYETINKKGYPIVEKNRVIASNKNVKSFSILDYEYNIEKKLSPEQMLDIASKLSNIETGTWVIGSNVSFFNSKQDMLWFSMYT